MDVEAILKQVDEYYGANKGKEAERLLKESVSQAQREGDDNSLLSLLNELIGYYRETSRTEDSYEAAGQALHLAGQMGLTDSIPYATTLLNAATAYRAGGSLQESLDCYRQAKEVYDRLLPEDDMLKASLYNNVSLLYQEMGEFERAGQCQEKALKIAEKNKAAYEAAVSRANLAGTCLNLGQDEAAFAYAKEAAEAFQEMGVEDTHYAAALSAMGSYYYKKKEYARAAETFRKAMNRIEASLGKNEHYRRLAENVSLCEAAAAREDEQGLALSREYYETYGRPMLEQQFAPYKDKIAAGLVGKGSDCFGFDDRYSRDHDWGPDFCLWVTEETYREIGEALSKAYESLPGEFKGFQRVVTDTGRGRRGVMTISGFYKGLLQAERYEDIDWSSVPDAALAAAVNGEVFVDQEGIFSQFRQKLFMGYPENIRYLKLAESSARFAQTAQYNYGRMKGRGDQVTARIMLADGVREAMKLQHYIEGKYPPHDKWLYKSTLLLSAGETLCGLLAGILREKNPEELIEQTGAFLAKELYDNSFISDTDSYLDAHTQELVYKAGISVKSDEELVEEIARLEFEAFDKVHNVGGRASCQNDWPTFSIMRKSQYLTWNRTMLLQYLYDFRREYERGHNLIEEKYGRMMESTAPGEYEKIKDHFPALSQEKKQIIEQIVKLQVGWMEEFSQKYPHLAQNARSVHTYDDNLYNTSYETYLRGELGTYSDKMLELYGRYVVEYARENRNLTFDIMTNSVKLYGYADLEAAEAFMKL